MKNHARFPTFELTGFLGQGQTLDFKNLDWYGDGGQVNPAAYVKRVNALLI